MKGEVFPRRLKIIIAIYKTGGWVTVRQIERAVREFFDADIGSSQLWITLFRLHNEGLLRRKKRSLFQISVTAAQDLHSVGILQKSANQGNTIRTAI